ncbi:tol-pal system protein YbgF [Methylobacterium sp. C25]|uniref:tol-pal system protein YbgF n=1 Tax=Methylobacterium sp. C25 TaxID=2721622 RepID=UPI001F418BDF|nr:tol-pal system protein YbgF [Methylobacterium sp. C25]MCE4223777.1 tol-pal system protein YbgF [Methylobacterium sp. C25]
MLRRLLFASSVATSLVFLGSFQAEAQDAADVIVRLNRVENVTRQLSGQIETLQYENRQLKEQLRKFQEDVEFRLQEGSKGGGGAAKRTPSASPSPSGTNPGEGRPGKRGDAFDPEQHPNAPGAPRQIGTAAPSAPVANPPVAREAEGSRRIPAAIDYEGADDDQDVGPSGPVDLSPPPSVPTTGAIEPTPSTSVAATGTGDAKSDFEAAYALVQGRQYEQAEMSLRQFIQSHPRDRLVPKATYWLGESYLQRNRSREAAEQFLKVSTDYAGSPVAPEAMLKLGASLNALGAKAQACATLAEIERKYPSATNTVRQGVEREQKRARCAA